MVRFGRGINLSSAAIFSPEIDIRSSYIYATGDFILIPASGGAAVGGLGVATPGAVKVESVNSTRFIMRLRYFSKKDSCIAGNGFEPLIYGL